MAVYFWVGGVGVWDNTNTLGVWKTTSGGAINAPNAPLVTDTATFDANSGTGAVGIAATATCAICTFGRSGITATLTANNTAFAALTISAGTFSTSTFNFTAGLITVTGGTFTANGGTITNAGLAGTGVVARTINLNASSLTTVNNGVITFSGTGLTFNCGTSTITCSSATPLFTGGANTFYNVSFTSTALGSAGSIIGANTFNNLTFASRAAVGLGGITVNANQIINGTLTISASTVLGGSRFFLRSSVIGTQFTITAATVSLTGVDFRDIAGAGAASWTGTRLGDCGGNSGITFPAAKTVYWNLTGSNNYNATGWATTQTGAPATTNFPLAQDTAVFTNTAPASGTITLGTAYNVGSLDFSTRSTALTFSMTSPVIYGNITLSSAITIAGAGTTVFAGRNITQTITSTGAAFTQAFTQSTIGGGVTFADAFATGSTYQHSNGSLATNFNFTCSTFTSSISNTRSITLGAMTFSLTGTGGVWTSSTITGLTFNAGTSKIALTGTSATARTFAGGGLTYNNLEIGGATGTSTLTFTGSNTFNTISSTKTVAHTLLFTAATTTTCANFTVTGTVGNIVTIDSVTAADHNLAKTGGGNISVDYMSITNSHATT